jgi:hypothetical protein
MNQIKIDNTMLEFLNSRYSRESKNVRFDYMVKTTVIVVGIGASGHMIEQLCRLGIKRWHLFDQDIVKKKNLISQNFIARDEDVFKTNEVKFRLQDCEFEKDNPDIPPLDVTTHGDFLAISDDEVTELLCEEHAKGCQVILIETSDYHPPKARANRIALRYGIPTFWAGIYRMGMAGEIIFFESGYGLPCYRCITESRYRFFDKNHLLDHLKGNFGASGQSLGLPMAASFIDSILGHLVIGAIHIDVEDNQHGKLFRRLLREKRNFIQCQLDPSYRLNDKEDIFAQIEGPDLIAFNTIFQQESPKVDCLDCALPNHIWVNTDYTRENYYKKIQKFCASKGGAFYSQGFKHPLLNEYADFFSEWQKHANIVT